MRPIYLFVFLRVFVVRFEVALLFTLSRCALASIASLILISSAQAQVQPRTVTDPQDLINWYYAATFGTGVYTAGDRSVTVLQLPYSRELKAVSEDSVGIRFKFSATLGFYDYSFNSAVSGDIPHRISTLSLMPGLEWQVPLSPRGTVRPYFDAGAGQEIAGRESAWIYDFGIKSRFVLAEDHGVEFALANSLTAAGYRPRGGPNNPFGYFAIGLDMTIPTEGSLFGRPANIGITPIYYYYFNRLRFAEFSDPDNRVREEFELAVSIVTHEPWSLKAFEFDRIGIAVRTSGDVTGISIFTSLPF